MMLERRDAAGGLHFRAYQDTPVVPFDDGTVLSFSAGRIALRAGEWLRVDQVTEVFLAFLEEREEPSFVRWRDVTPVSYP